MDTFNKLPAFPCEEHSTLHVSQGGLTRPAGLRHVIAALNELPEEERRNVAMAISPELHNQLREAEAAARAVLSTPVPTAIERAKAYLDKYVDDIPF